MTPDITIGIPAYDEWAKLDRLLSNLHAQETGLIYEIIVVDDCHPDNLAARCERVYPTTRVFRQQVNQGPACARNLIIREARAPYIAFLDADCEVPPRWLENVAPHLRDNRLISGRVVRPDGSLEWGPRRATWLGVSLPCRLEEANVASSNNLFTPTRVAREIGGFNEGLRIYFEDSLFSLLFRRAGGEVIYLPEAEVTHHHHSLRNPARLTLQARNTLWSMYHYYRGRPMLRLACTTGLCTLYLARVGSSLLRLEPAFSIAYLRGIAAGLSCIARRRWRQDWVGAPGASDAGDSIP